MENEDIQKLLAASKGKLSTGNPPSDNPQNVQALISEIPAAHQAQKEKSISDDVKQLDQTPVKRGPSRHEFYINGNCIGDADKFSTVFKMILDHAMAADTETIIQSKNLGVIGKVVPGQYVKLTWDISKSSGGKEPVHIKGYRVVIPFDKIKDVIHGINSDYYNLDQSTLNRIVSNPRVNQNDEIDEEDSQEVIENKPAENKPAENKPAENKPATITAEPTEDIIKKRREEFKIPAERPVGKFGPLGICLAVKASHSPNKAINEERLVSVARYFGLTSKDKVVIGKSENLVGKMLMISPYNDDNQYLVIGIEPTKEQYKKILTEGQSMKSEAHISSLVRQLKHDRFYSMLKQASDMQDPFLMAAMMAKYSKTIEQSDPELSVQLLMTAKGIVDDE